MPSSIPLDPHQQELVMLLVEATRRLRPEQRGGFMYQHMFPDPTPVLDLPGLTQPVPISFADIEALKRAGLIFVRKHNSAVGNIDITPDASEYYEAIKRSRSEPTEQVEVHVTSFLDGHAFRTRFPSAYDKWKQAVSLLWSKEATAHLSTIGHLCREAMQEFAESIARASTPSAVVSDKAKTVKRIREALARINSETDRALLDALLVYWGTVADLTQRQEHAGQKEGTEVSWDDARRVVFQTAVVMFEIGSTIR